MASGGGRPTKLTPEVQERLTSAIRAGNFYEAACGYAGIDYRTFRRWMERGERESRGPYRAKILFAYEPHFKLPFQGELVSKAGVLFPTSDSSCPCFPNS